MRTACIIVCISYSLTMHSTVRCFKWNMADLCGEDLSLRCSLRNRANSCPDLINGMPGSTTMRSPGYCTNNLNYKNNMFCVYNISVSNCDTDRILIRSVDVNSSLSDGNTGEDYLWMDFGTGYTREWTGNQTGSISETGPSTSFYAVLWSNKRRERAGGYSSRGSFEIEAVCDD